MKCYGPKQCVLRSPAGFYTHCHWTSDGGENKKSGWDFVVTEQEAPVCSFAVCLF